MKKLLLSITVIISVLFAATSCSQTESEDACKVKSQTSITIGLPTTRTSLGEKEGDNYPTYWSENDMIVANGVTSTSLTLGADKTSAIFGFANSILTPPFHITYPYSEGSLCTENRPTVVFNAEQNYVEGTFGVGNAPMCGYYEGGERTVLKHLAGILRFAIKGSTTLAKIEILANEEVALAGEFDVNCQTGTISAIEGKTTNKITYIVNETLSNEESKALYVAIPHGNLGQCKVVITDDNGCTMILQLNATNVKAGIVREFKEFTYRAGVSITLEGFGSEEDELIVDYPEPIEPANNEIWYTPAITGQTINYYSGINNGNATEIELFGAKIVSNICIGDGNKAVITFDGDVTQVGRSAFFNTNLVDITLPKSVTFIAANAFMWCRSLRAFYGALASADNRCLILDNSIRAFAPAELTEYTTPKYAIEIGSYVFFDCANLSKVIISNSIKTIGGGAFSGCSNLTEISIPNSVERIADSVFAQCSNLKSVTIPESVTSLGNFLFQNCYALSEVYFKSTTPPMPSSSTWGKYSFSSCINLKKIYVPYTSYEAYKTAEGLKDYADIITPYDFEKGEVVKIIPETYKIHYTATAKVEPSKADVFGANIVSNEWDSATGVGVITFDNEVTSIGDSAFSECSSLTSVTIPNSVTLIGEEAFYFCLQLIEVTLGNNIAKIGDFAFYHCGKLSSITIPSKVTSLGDYTFYNCSCLKDVYCMPTIPPSIGNWTLSEYIQGSASYPLKCKIYVPRESIDTYKTQKYWSVHSSRIEPYDF